MRRLPPLTGLRAFEAAARHAGFRRAAEELGVTPTAVSHQIRALEERLGVDLFERRVRQVMLTAAGRTLFPGLRDGFDALAAAVAMVDVANRARPAVTVSATPAFTSLWLLPRMARLQAAFPEIDLRLHASDEPVDLAAGRVDIAIRHGAGPWPGIETVFTRADHFAPVVNPSLGVLAPGDLSRVPLIHFEWRRPDGINPDWEMWRQAAGIEIAPPSHLRFSEETHALQAAIAGQGVALASLLFAEDEIRAGRLVQPFGPVLSGRACHLLLAPGKRSTAANAAADWLARELGEAGSGSAREDR